MFQITRHFSMVALKLTLTDVAAFRLGHSGKTLPCVHPHARAPKKAAARHTAADITDHKVVMSDSSGIVTRSSLMCVYIYIYIDPYTHTHTHTHTHVCVCVCILMYIDSYTHTHTHAHKVHMK